MKNGGRIKEVELRITLWAVSKERNNNPINATSTLHNDYSDSDLELASLRNPETDSKSRTEWEDRQHPHSREASRRYREEARANP